MHSRQFRLFAALGIGLALAGCSTTDTLTLTQPTVVQASFDPQKYAAIVVDASNGRPLYEANAGAQRYPASLTKMMTLYLMFEAIESGRLRLDTAIPVSGYAASRPPTKMGFSAGETISVDEAIRALVVKSANDVAVAVAEYLGGSEEAFAAQMTSKARTLGMTGTVFRNASGLPATTQRTTARDMALLGLALRKRFPRTYPYFMSRDFIYRGKLVRGHNKLLGLGGIDGIKTGYIRASGFNIVTSVNRDGKQLIVVVLGGKSADLRNAHVQELIARSLPRARRSGGS